MGGGVDVFVYLVQCVDVGFQQVFQVVLVYGMGMQNYVGQCWVGVQMEYGIDYCQVFLVVGGLGVEQIGVFEFGEVVYQGGVLVLGLGCQVGFGELYGVFCDGGCGCRLLLLGVRGLCRGVLLCYVYLKLYIIIFII